MKRAVPVAELVGLYRALASRSRLRIICRLAERPMCVKALARSLGISQPAVSQHLDVLRSAGLVAGQRMGVRVHYRLQTPRVRLVCASTARLAGRVATRRRGCDRHAEGLKAVEERSAETRSAR